MTSTEVSVCSDCHNMMLNQWLILLVSYQYVMIYSRLTVCQASPEPFKDHSSTNECQTGLSKSPEQKQTVKLLAVLHTCTVSLLM